ncbi:hypothetical protein GCM10027519_36010 [Kineococcus endophyticus]
MNPTPVRTPPGSRNVRRTTAVPWRRTGTNNRAGELVALVDMTATLGRRRRTGNVLDAHLTPCEAALTPC